MLVMSDHEQLAMGLHNLSRIMRKLAFCICENKGADQLHGKCAADQSLCFCLAIKILVQSPLLPKSEISSFLPSSVCVGPG